MDITSLVLQGREQALLDGSYSTYHRQLAKRLLNTRKKLGIASRNRGKFHGKDSVTPEEIAQNPEYVRLQLLTSERTWAQAMSIKVSHDPDRKGITGHARSHIISRLTKATHTADDLAQALAQSDVSGAAPSDILEAKSYASMIRGAMFFEKQSWELSLQNYSTSRIIYSALAATKGDLFKDLLTETIDPSIRYAAYQLQTPRTVPVPAIARKAFPESNTTLVDEINQINPTFLSQGDTETAKGVPGAENAPKTLVWRSREVNIEDAQIALAWGSVMQAKERLSATILESREKRPNELAAAYDDGLMAAQDAVDATKQAIEEMRSEGVEQSDPRMQSLQITRTAVNFEMISWRIGRNRVLTGPGDGAKEEYESSRRKTKAKQDQEEPPRKEKELPSSKKLAKLKEKVALYDATLQSIETVKELPGVANDQELSGKIDGFYKYFEALKGLAIARSHAITNQPANALALIHHAHKLSQEAVSKLSGSASSKGPPTIEVVPEAAESLEGLLNGEVKRHQAIVYIDNLRKEDEEDLTENKTPLIERLNEYPAAGVDLTNIVEYPPKMALVPVKPIFLDVAWNYIEYPGKTVTAQAPAQAPATDEAKPAQEQTQQQSAKRGWFGFGRS